MLTEISPRSHDEASDYRVKIGEVFRSGSRSSEILTVQVSIRRAVVSETLAYVLSVQTSSNAIY